MLHILVIIIITYYGGDCMERFANELILKDIKLFMFLNKRLRNRIMDKIMLYITHLGGAPFTISLTIFFILIKPRLYPLLGWEILLTLTSSHFLVHIIKRLINRARPCEKLENIKQLIIPFESYSFPSGHTTASFSLFLILLLALLIRS